MKYSLSIFLFLISINNSIAQHLVYQNFDIKNEEKNQIVSIISSYINGNYKASQIFSSFDISNYKSIDLYKESLSLDGSLYDITYDVNVLSIKKEGENYFANCLLYWHNNDTEDGKKTITILGIVDFWVVKNDGKWKISNYLNYHTKNWSKISVGNIEYIYNPEHPFDLQKAKFAADFYKNILVYFNINSNEILRYYIGKNCYEIYKMCGFDYFIGEGSENNLCAFYDEKNNIIYTSTTYGELHHHEIVHVLNKYFENCNVLIKIGLSSYINDGSSRNLPIFYHFENFENYLKKEKLDFENFENFQNIDETTNISYVTGALICNAIYRKGGKKMLLEYMNSTKEIKDLKEKLKIDFKVKNFESFFLNEIKNYRKQGKGLLFI